jgi:hypothetical protein
LKALLLNVVFWGTAAWFGAEVVGAAGALTRPVEPVAQSPRPAPPAATVARLRWPDLDAFSDVTERPLFTPGRRPPAAAVAAPDPSSPPPPFALIGVIGAGADRVALMRGPDGTARRGRVGDVVDGWRIDRVDPRAVTWRRGEEARRTALGAASAPSAARKGRSAPDDADEGSGFVGARFGVDVDVD